MSNWLGMKDEDFVAREDFIARVDAKLAELGFDDYSLNDILISPEQLDSELGIRAPYEKLRLALLTTFAMAVRYGRHPKFKVGVSNIDPQTGDMIVFGINGQIPNSRLTEAQANDRAVRSRYTNHPDRASLDAMARKGMATEGLIQMGTLFHCDECATSLTNTGVKLAVCDLTKIDEYNMGLFLEGEMGPGNQGASFAHTVKKFADAGIRILDIPLDKDPVKQALEEGIDLDELDRQMGVFTDGGNDQTIHMFAQPLSIPVLAK